MEDFTREDFLSLAFASVENEVKDSLPSNTDKANLSKDNNFASKVPSAQKELFQDAEDDIFALALEDVEKEPLKKTPPKKIKSLIGVDLCFDVDTEVQKLEKGSASTKDKFNLGKNKSEVHTGDTDSSDDEDNKYFEETRYNSYGKSLKKTILGKEKNESSGLCAEHPWKKKSNNVPFSPAIPKQVIKTEKIDVSADPIFGIRIVNPLVSSQTIRETMQGRTPVGCFKIKSHVKHGDLKVDWVFAAVLVRKFPPRVSQKGNNYSMWILSDLKNDLKTVLLFLFGKAHEDLWKTPSGVVLALLNPGVLSDDKTSEYEAKLSIKSADQVMIWGKSKDLGQCKSRKKNGENCGTFVNTAQCEFCVYHVKQEYKKYNSRVDFGNNDKVNLRNKVLGKNEVFYGGKSFTAVVGKKATNPKDASRLHGLGTSPLPSHKSPVQIPNLQRSNEILKLLPKGTMNKLTDEKRLSSLNSSAGKQGTFSEHNKSTVENKPKLNKNPLGISEKSKPSLTNPGGEICVELDFTDKKRSNLAFEKVKLPKKSSPTIQNKLQKRFNGLMSISSEIGESKKKSVFSSTPSLKDKNKESLPANDLQVSQSFTSISKSFKKDNSKDLKSAKTAPISELKKESLPSPGAMKNVPFTSPVSCKNDRQITDFGSQSPERITNFDPVLSSTPNLPRKPPPSFKPPNSGLSKAKLKALAFVKNHGPISKSNAKGTDPEKRGVKRFLSGSDDNDIENEKQVLSQRFIDLMNQKSIHEDLVEMREIEQEAEYFEKLEKKDRLEEKMLNTYKVDCKAVRCLKCNYIWFSASDACKAEGHPTKVIDALKRFFKCGKCSNRTISLTVYPLIPCKKCSSSNWVRAPMIREKLAKNESLCIRGEEQKYLNSLSTSGSLNLLVPD